MLQAQRAKGVAQAGAFKVRGLRWWIIGLVFLATFINYIDRLTLSVLGPVITEELGLSNTAFGGIVAWFLLAYTISQAVSGKLYDRIGTRLGFMVSVVVWSLAAMAHAFARGVASLSAARFVLGLGEAGNWPGAAKAIAEWFPVRQRAFAMAIFNSGAALGSVAAPPLIVFLALAYGWQAAFLVTGALGFAWLALWWLFYRTPEEHPWLTAQEYALIREGGAGSRAAAAAPAPSWRELLRHRQVWGIVCARLLTDPVWWLYLTWLPLYLAQVRGFTLKDIALFAWVPFLAADAGSLLGGWLSGHLIVRGWSVDRARKAVIAGGATLMLAGAGAAFVKDPLAALALIGVVLFGFQVWINNVQTLPSDFFPSRAVASVAGLGGTGAGIGSMIFVFATGAVVDHFSYTPVLVTAALLAPAGTLALFALAGPIRPLPLRAARRSHE
jgi:MFS transporter, ACS family, hexuronate transporter